MFAQNQEREFKRLKRADEQIRFASKTDVRTELEPFEERRLGAMVGAAVSPVVTRGGCGPTFPVEELYWGAIGGTWTLSAGKITLWGGLGSSGLLGAQTTDAYRPLTGYGIGDRPTAVFAGSQYIVVPSFAIGIFDIYLVIKLSVWPKTIIGQGTSVYSDSGISMFSGQSTSTAINRGSGTTTLSARQSYYPDWLPTDNVGRLIRFGHDGTHSGHVLEKDGVGVQQTTAYSSNNPGQGVITKDLVIGGSGIFSSLITGEIGAILVYNTAPNAERAGKVLAWSRSYFKTL